jgi:hypothetical protein
MSGPDDWKVEGAVALARAALGLDTLQPARTWPVARMRSGARPFLLVVFGPPDRTSAVAAVDTVSGEVLEAARLPGRHPHTLISAAEAILRAGFGPGTEAQLVWEPSPVSRSPFYPLWQLRSPERTAWVDSLRGEVWDTLDAPRGGGSGGE